jgi:hypothetical protein
MKFDLKKGVEITPFLFDQIRAEEDKSSIKNYLFSFWREEIIRVMN